MVFASLLLAVDLLDAGVPAGIVERLRAYPAASRMAARAQHRLLDDASIPENKILRFQFGLLERPADKFRFCWGLLAPSTTDRDFLPLPTPLFPLYYAFRPLRLVAKHSALAARRAWANAGGRLDPPQ